MDCRLPNSVVNSFRKRLLQKLALNSRQCSLLFKLLFGVVATMDIGRHLPGRDWFVLLKADSNIAVSHLRVSFVRYKRQFSLFSKIVLKYLVSCCSIARFSLSNGHRRLFSHRALFTNTKNSQWCSTPALVQAYC